MFAKLELFQMAQGMASNAATRQAVIARNIAQADTPGYKTADVKPFAETYAAQDDFTANATRKGHLAASQPWREQPVIQTATGAEASPNGNTVSLEVEMTKAAETRTQHDMALGIYKSALNILRSSLGR